MRLEAIAVTLLCGSACYGQESRASIVGRIADASGGVIIGAKVQATNAATNTGASTVTNTSGNYEIPYLLPGLYRIAVEMPGFKTAVRDAIGLRVSDRLTLDFSIELGDVSQSVIVTGETPLLDVATASLGIVMDERRISELPIPGGNPFYLSRLSPGVVTTAGHSAGNPMQYDIATGAVVNGTRSGSTEVTLDGVPNMFEGSAAFSPPQDLVQEFRIQTATFDASLGHAAGGVVNVSMKSGANTLHGTGYGFHSPYRTVPWFANRFLYDPTTGPITPEKREQVVPEWLHQRWGATLSGRVRLPGIYNGQNRTFWTFGYEGLYVHRKRTYRDGAKPRTTPRRLFRPAASRFAIPDL